MKKIKSVSGVLRVLGIVLLIMALVLEIYALATNGSAWNAFSDRYSQSGVKVTTLDRFAFNHAYYLALRGAMKEGETATSIRAKNAAAQFGGFLSRAEEAEQVALDQLTLEQEDWFNHQFDADAFLDVYNNLMNNPNSAEIREIFEYLDGLSKPPLKSGKVLPKLKTTTGSRTWFEEHYALWKDQYGENTGSLLEYMQTIERLIKADGGVTDAISFAETLTYEAYQTELASTVGLQGSEDLVLFVSNFASQLENKAEGTQTSSIDFLQTEFIALLDNFPESAKPDYAVYLTVVRGALEDLRLNTYDGSYSMLLSRVQKAQSEEDGQKFSTFLQEFSRSLVENSDNRRAVPLSAFAWLLAANALLFGLIGILLIVSAFVLARIATDTIIKKREYNAKQNDPDKLLLVRNLSQYFKSGEFINKAVDGVSFYIKKGEVFGLVGESGCGKTTTGRTIINLYDPTNGDVFYRGLRISSTKNGAPLMCQQMHKELDIYIAEAKADAEERSKQEPSRASEIARECNQRIAGLRQKHRKAVKQVQYHAFESEEEKCKCAMLYHDQRKAELLEKYEQDIQNLTGTELDKRKKRYREDLAIVSRENIMTKIQMIFQDPIASIDPRMTVHEIIAEGLIIRGVKDKEIIDRKVNEMLDLVGLLPEHASRYPHEFSGGQRQRIGIARAIVLEPELIIADEPISALDVSIQAQIINLLNDLRERMGLTIMFIAHNLSVVKYFSDRIAVMYYGKIVEMAPSEELFQHPLHPYTKSLLSAIPYPDPHYEKQRKRVEYEPSLVHDYRTDKPELHEITPGHYIYCNQQELLNYQQELKL